TAHSQRPQDSIADGARWYRARKEAATIRGKGKRTMTIRHALSVGTIVWSSTLVLAPAALGYPTIVTQGMTILKPGAQPGYVIFAAPDGAVYAVNAQGQVAKKWTSPEPGSDLGYTRPLPNGNLLGRIQKRQADGSLAETGGADIFEMTQAG